MFVDIAALLSRKTASLLASACPYALLIAIYGAFYVFMVNQPFTNNKQREADQVQAFTPYLEKYDVSLRLSTRLF
ncbi:hypothetical protein [Ahrensia marina]|uniref:hypothetical protein n=1 Tax=Ahrensia marina TaxID=1514904 RepID=UPI000ADC98A6|nr:hypothetical protein [Ahrensia marina]